MKWMLAVVSLALASGCAGPYKPDLSGKPVARLRVLALGPYDVDAGVLETDCEPRTRGGWEANFQKMATVPARGKVPPVRETLGMPASPPADLSYVERQIPAGVPLSLAFVGSRGGATCSFTRELVAREGAEYEAVLGVGYTPGICTLSIHGLAPVEIGRAHV